ncbi:unnamed protein product [Mytilus edulis]|uniref:Uncharacterized protein n=1 Tax=Mytilus edulis TaxID=6550 RepID=A0A8S3T1R6_MYTED|nr:unnamed protein product [Mytilus edulis]
MTSVFYLDLGCTFLLKVTERLSCCVTTNEADNQDGSYEESLKWKRRILWIRTTIGIIFNITAFITVCVVYKEIIIEGKTALGLFITIIVFTVISYFVSVVSVLVDDDKDTTNSRILESMIFYRIYEIEFDVLVFFYSLVLSDWKMTEFTTATTVLACVDLVLSILMLVQNCYEFDDKIYAIFFILFAILFPPLPPICLFIVIIRRKYYSYD